jgi:hypothetical protein
MDSLTSLLNHCNKKGKKNPGTNSRHIFHLHAAFQTACSYANLSKMLLDLFPKLNFTDIQALLQGKTLDFVFVIECTSGVPILSAKTFTMRKLPTETYGTRPTPIQAAA